MMKPRECKTVLGIVAAVAAIAWLAPATVRADTMFVTSSGGHSYAIYQYPTLSSTPSSFGTGLDHPSGMAFDNRGDMFEADQGSGNINEFTPGPGGTYTQSTFAAGLDYPSYLAVDQSGNLYVSSLGHGGGYIYEFTPGGTQTTFAAGLTDPNGLAFDRSGNLFVADYSAGQIDEFSADGKTQTTFAQMSNPMSLAFDSAGNLLVADTWGEIDEFTPGFNNQTDKPIVVGSGLGISPINLAFNSAGTLFAAQENAGQIDEFTPNGSGGYTASKDSINVSSPSGIAFDDYSAPIAPEPSVLAAQVALGGLLLGGTLLLRRYRGRFIA